MQRDEDSSESVVGDRGGDEHNVCELKQGSRSKRSTIEKLRGKAITMNRK
jgi:hypothetical protein